MNKIKACLALIFLFSLPGIVLSNSSPVYRERYPSSDVMAIDRYSPIIVENEDLVFDFSDSDNNYDTLTGKVTATYGMFNPTNEFKSVDMQKIGITLTILRLKLLFQSRHHIL